MNFQGVLTQSGSCANKNCSGPPRSDISPNEGWIQLYNIINNDVQTTTITRIDAFQYSTDIRYQS